MAIISSTSNNQNQHECNKLISMVAKASPLTPLLDGLLGLVLLVGGLGDGVGFVWLVVGGGAVVLLNTVSGSVVLSPHTEAMIT